MIKHTKIVDKPCPKRDSRVPPCGKGGARVHEDRLSAVFTIVTAIAIATSLIRHGGAIQTLSHCEPNCPAGRTAYTSVQYRQAGGRHLLARPSTVHTHSTQAAQGTRHDIHLTQQLLLLREDSVHKVPTVIFTCCRIKPPNCPGVPPAPV